MWETASPYVTLAKLLFEVSDMSQFCHLKKPYVGHAFINFILQKSKKGTERVSHLAEAPNWEVAKPGFEPGLPPKSIH